MILDWMLNMPAGIDNKLILKREIYKECKGTTINDLGGHGGNWEKKEALLQEKKNLKGFLQEKKLERPSPGKKSKKAPLRKINCKKVFHREKNGKAIARKNKNSFSNFPLGPPDH